MSGQNKEVVFEKSDLYADLVGSVEGRYGQQQIG